jgi:hypothetical protein
VEFEEAGKNRSGCRAGPFFSIQIKSIQKDCVQGCPFLQAEMERHGSKQAMRGLAPSPTTSQLGLCVPPKDVSKRIKETANRVPNFPINTSFGTSHT